MKEIMAVHWQGQREEEVYRCIIHSTLYKLQKIWTETTNNTDLCHSVQCT